MSTSPSSHKYRNNIAVWVAIGIMMITAVWVRIKNTPNKSSEKNKFLNPVVSTQLGPTVMENKAINLENELKAYEESLIAKGDIINLSVYFRNLTNGNWFGLEEKEMFSPASLMKLPLLLAYFKLEEQQPGYLQTKILFTPNGSADEYKQNIAPAARLETNHTYKIIDIIKHMIRYSDNQASVFLEKNIAPELFKSVFTDVGIPFPPMIDGSFDNNIRVVDYASFFRALYNASYLSQKHSEEVLELLTKTDFQDGLVAGISDAWVSVAHKFGERSLWWSNGIERMQLHDCGIVYYPEHPYVLCMMTRGYDRNKLKEVLHQVSNIIYQEVARQYANK